MTHYVAHCNKATFYVPHDLGTTMIETSLMNWSDFGSLAELIAAFAAVATIGWAVLEFRRRRIADLDARAAELLGVALTYQLVRPRDSEVLDGKGRFTYNFTLHNPGRLPISLVQVRICYPGPVQRIHSNGEVDLPAINHELTVAAVAPHGQHAWRRTLDVPCELWEQLRNTEASIAFTCPDGGRCLTTWPRAPQTASSQLRSRLRRIGVIIVNDAKHEKVPLAPSIRRSQ